MTAGVLEHVYEPVGSAMTLFKSKAPEILLSGPAGTGKSRACLEKMHMMAIANPGFRGLIVRKTMVSLASTALVTFREHVAKETIEAGYMKFYGGSRQSAASFVYRNGSSITIGGLDRATRIMSSEYDAIYVQEAIELTEDDWEILSTRLRNGKVSFQQLMADTNPAGPTHWLKARCDADKTLMVYCQHEDNPTLWDRSSEAWTPPGRVYIDRLDNLSGVRFERLRKGLWAAAEGLVYDMFDPEVHLLPALIMPPDDWPRYWAIDFGFRNPFVCQMWTADPDGRLRLYHEIYMTQRTVAEHCQVLRDWLNKGDGHRKDKAPEWIVTDHDAEGRATFEDEMGLSTIPAHKSVLEGIEYVKERLKPDRSGKPGLYICRAAVSERDPVLADAKKPLCTEDEMLEYVWEDKGTKEAPRKVSDHGMDAMRYLVAEIDSGARPNFRWL